MDKKKFDAMLILIVPDVIKLITNNYSVDEITAANIFYESGVYADLEVEETKLWHFSPLTIYNMFDEEQKTGAFIYPEET